MHYTKKLTKGQLSCQKRLIVSRQDLFNSNSFEIKRTNDMIAETSLGMF